MDGKNETILDIFHLSIDFGGLQAVNDVSFSVKSGEIYGLIGPNGAGKTTLMNLICGTYSPTSGRIVFGGTDIQGLPPYRIAKIGISRTYQNINLFKGLSVGENVLVGTHTLTEYGLIDAIFNSKRKRFEDETTRQQAQKWLEYFGLEEKKKLKAGNLSYGDQRKLEMARALASQPRLLLLDEPAAGMNLKEKEDLSNTILDIQRKGYTVLIVEHNMKLIMKICDRITVLDHGKKIAEGNPEEIQKNQDVIDSYLGIKK